MTEAMRLRSLSFPSAVVPMEPSGKPVAFWWDDQAFHVDGKAYAWSDLKAKPVNGATFRIDLGVSSQREPIVLEGRIKLSASRYRIGEFGVVGNAVVSNVTEVIAASDGRVSTRLYASGQTPDYINLHWQLFYPVRNYRHCPVLCTNIRAHVHGRLVSNGLWFTGKNRTDIGPGECISCAYGILELNLRNAAEGLLKVPGYYPASVSTQRDNQSFYIKESCQEHPG